MLFDSLHLFLYDDLLSDIEAREFLIIAPFICLCCNAKHANFNLVNWIVASQLVPFYFSMCLLQLFHYLKSCSFFFFICNIDIRLFFDAF